MIVETIASRKGREVGLKPPGSFFLKPCEKCSKPLLVLINSFIIWCTSLAVYVLPCLARAVT